ncbi:MAG: hypothetical protein NVSMB38_41530 [Ktedonobacteraceae bacterium]
MAQQITTLCEALCITLDPIDWEHAGMRAEVRVNTLLISDLLDLGQLESDALLRRMRMKLLEHATWKAAGVQPGLRALIWSPLDVVQPQAFLSLWVLTMETHERIAVAEYLSNGARVYEHYAYDTSDEQQLRKLFGPLQSGEYHLGETVTIEEHEQKYRGDIVYILAPGKPSTSRPHPSRGHHTILGKTYTNDASSRYVVACNDGFPHIVNQSQVTVREETDDARD